MAAKFYLINYQSSHVPSDKYNINKDSNSITYKTGDKQG
jgi:hypothetical protein